MREVPFQPQEHVHYLGRGHSPRRDFVCPGLALSWRQLRSFTNHSADPGDQWDFAVRNDSAHLGQNHGRQRTPDEFRGTSWD